MQWSEKRANLIRAMARAQAKMGTAVKNKANPGFQGAKYADIGAVWDAISAGLAEEGILVTSGIDSTKEAPGKTGGILWVETVFMLPAGDDDAVEWVSESVPIPLQAVNAHAVGSALTYGRRYGVLALAFVPVGDDDGNRAMNGGAPVNGRDPRPQINARIDAAAAAILKIDQAHGPELDRMMASLLGKNSRDNAHVKVLERILTDFAIFFKRVRPQPQAAQGAPQQQDAPQQGAEAAEAPVQPALVSPEQVTALGRAMNGLPKESVDHCLRQLGVAELRLVPGERFGVAWNLIQEAVRNVAQSTAAQATPLTVSTTDGEELIRRLRSLPKDAGAAFLAQFGISRVRDLPADRVKQAFEFIASRTPEPETPVQAVTPPVTERPAPTQAEVVAISVDDAAALMQRLKTLPEGHFAKFFEAFQITDVHEIRADRLDRAHGYVTQLEQDVARVAKRAAAATAHQLAPNLRIQAGVTAIINLDSGMAEEVQRTISAFLPDGKTADDATPEQADEIVGQLRDLWTITEKRLREQGKKVA